MTSVRDNCVSPGRESEMVSGLRRAPPSAVQLAIRKRCPVLSIPAAGFEVVIGNVEAVIAVQVFPRSSLRLISANGFAP